MKPMFLIVGSAMLLVTFMYIAIAKNPTPSIEVDIILGVAVVLGSVLFSVGVGPRPRINMQGGWRDEANKHLYK